METLIKLIIMVFLFLFLFFILLAMIKRRHLPSCYGPTSGNENVVKRKTIQLKDNGQKALDAIYSKRKLSASDKRAKRSQHVFNNGLLGFHRSVLQALLKDVGGYNEQLKNLVQDLVIPLSPGQIENISKMVAYFSRDEFYVDYNACVFGEYVRVLRKELVAYLKADTSVNEYDTTKIQERVNHVANQMVNHEVYVDEMARDRWLEQNPRKRGDYDLVKLALKEMFQNITQAFQRASDKIRGFRMSNNWS